MSDIDPIPSSDALQFSIKSINISGQRFGMLTAITVAGKTKNQTTIWLCKCDCGNGCIADISKLRRGRVKSCGCSKGRLISEQNKQHGLTKSKIHEAWCSMRYRCENPDSQGYENYGGRGITVCERWHSFDHFLADMGHPPSAQHSLDRIDNDGNYEPSNCQWATKAQQSRNRRSNLTITHQGISRSLVEWREVQGIAKGTVEKRRRLGWTIKQALGLDPRPDTRQKG